MLTESPAPSSTSKPDVEPTRGRVSPLSDWLALTLFTMFAVFFAIRASAPVDDPDTWWHLRLGEEFRGAWSLSDPGSLTTFATRPWFATQWTLEVVASYIQQAFGLAGIAWLSGVGVVALTVAVYFTSRQRGNVAAAALASTLALMASSMSHGPRPQMASFILAAVVTAAWLRAMNDLKPRWWLIPLIWLWACTHGMWFIGVVIGVVVVIGLLLDGRLTRSSMTRLGLVPLGGLLAAAVTPVGPKLILAPLATSKMARFITEWHAPDFSDLVPALAATMIAVVVATWARSTSRRSWADILLLALAAGWIVLYLRTIAVGVVIAAPLLAGSIQSWLPAERMRVKRREVAGAAVAAAAIVVGLAIAAPSRGNAPLETMDRMNAALDRLPSGTVVYNDYALGGWLEWRHRNVVPVIDGLTDAYYVSDVATYMKTRRLRAGWSEAIDRTGADYALLASDKPLPAAMVDSEQWVPLVRESGFVLLRRSGTSG